MNWQQVCEHPKMKDMPFKIELNERGQIIMSPVKAYHSIYQAEISYILRSNLKNGKALVECAVKTSKGTKVADAAWASQQRLEIIKHETECSIAPEICVEVLSESNTDEEIQEKKQLYFENGAQEVWICTEHGDISFFYPDGEQKKSALAPNFPKKIEI